VQEPKGAPKDFAFLDIRQYGHAMLTRPFESCSALLDAFFSERALSERMRQRGGDLLRLLVNTSERLQRKIAAQEQELLESENREQLQIYGDLLHANLYAIQKGDTSATVPNYYDEALSNITIPLDPALSPAQNAQKYYAQYRRPTMPKRSCGSSSSSRNRITSTSIRCSTTSPVPALRPS
jgi:predicted ribosome quality control (RQC) complex YloA/Tae2 family protein